MQNYSDEILETDKVRFVGSQNYDSVRTTHLHDLQTMLPGHLLYRDRMYDFEEHLAERVSLERSTRLQTVRCILTANEQFIEITSRSW
jgi:hypothetical protein